MQKRNKIKKIMAILAIFLFIGPIFIVAVMNYSSYYVSKHQQTTDTTATTTSASSDE